MSRSYTYASEYPAQNERFGIYGILKRKTCQADISKMGTYDVGILKLQILV